MAIKFVENKDERFTPRTTHNFRIELMDEWMNKWFK